MKYQDRNPYEKAVRRSTPYKVGGRRVYINQRGEYETRRGITVRSGKKFVNVPSFNTKTGEDFKSEKQAKRVARRRGEMSREFKTVEKAVKASKKKSAKIGRKLDRKINRANTKAKKKK
tara:strand:- start:375 stop:731 length:357 start_codon:yes stop_codon:yes gene_type:complete